MRWVIRRRDFVRLVDFANALPPSCYSTDLNPATIAAGAFVVLLQSNPGTRRITNLYEPTARPKYLSSIYFCATM